jgi:hypothetical protein
MTIGKTRLIWYLGKWRGVGWFVESHPAFCYTWEIRIPWICEIKRVRE